MICKITAILLGIFLIAFPAHSATRPPEAVPCLNVILLGGQSNMAGAGNYEALSETDKQRVLAVSSRIRLSIDGNPARPLSYTFSKHQLANRGFGNCFGPELFIGVTLAEANPEQNYLFIKVSQGGTALYGAWNPEWSLEQSLAVEQGEWKQSMKLYEKHIAAIRKQLDAMDAQGTTSKIVGMAWMQGENDAAKEVSARSYETNLKKLIAGYRTEFSIPEMPFVCGQINSHYGNFPAGPKMVRQAFVNVANGDENVAVIRTRADAPWTDYPKHEDQVHYNAEGQKRLGTAMGSALIKLMKP